MVFTPGLNEELAATAVMGSQLAATRPGARYDGVLGIWFGKAPGLDRASDAIRHAVYAGTHHRGGVVALVGDASCKSSTLPSASEASLAELFVPRVATDGTWRSTPSHVLCADLIAGEVHDLRAAVEGWAEPGTDRSRWDHVVVADHPYDTLLPASGPPSRRIEELPALSVTELAPGRHLVDFGQNSNGWIRLTDLGPEAPSSPSPTADGSTPTASGGPSS